MIVGPPGPNTPLPQPTPASQTVAAGGESDDRDADGRDLTGQRGEHERREPPADEDGEEPPPLTSLDVRV